MASEQTGGRNASSPVRGPPRAGRGIPAAGWTSPGRRGAVGTGRTQVVSRETLSPFGARGFCFFGIRGETMAFAHLTGIFPRSEELITATRAFERGRADKSALDRLFEEEAQRLVALEGEHGLDSVTDGLLRWQDLLRPLADELPGVHAGPVTRWFDNNSFYRRPVIEAPLEPVGGGGLRGAALR